MAELLTTQQVAKLLGMTVFTLRYHIRQGRLRRAAKGDNRGSGARNYFDRADVEVFRAWYETNTTLGKAKTGR